LRALLNESLATQRGELIRFDLIERPDGKTHLIFTWAHALMDAPGLSICSRFSDARNWPGGRGMGADTYPRLSLPKRCKLAWKNLTRSISSLETRHVPWAVVTLKPRRP